MTTIIGPPNEELKWWGILLIVLGCVILLLVIIILIILIIRCHRLVYRPICTAVHLATLTGQLNSVILVFKTYSCC